MACNCKKHPQSKTPYNGMIHEEKLVSPLIKYGVNPVSGKPLTADLLASMIDGIDGLDLKNAGLPKTTFSAAIVGERRHVLIQIFAARAKMLFGNAVRALNIQFDAALKKNYYETYRAMLKNELYRYDSEDTARITIFSSDVFSRESYESRYNNHPIEEERVGRDRLKMSRLVDLEYYMCMPIGTVLENILSAAAIDYAYAINRFENMLSKYKEDSEIVNQYDGVVEFIALSYINLIAAAEEVVVLLGEEANSLIEAGYPYTTGVTYDYMTNARIAAFDSVYKEKALIGEKRVQE